MKVSIILTRLHGVRLPKARWSQQIVFHGELSVAVTQDNRLNRLSKTARLVRETPLGAIELMDADIAWVNDERLLLTGFETCERDGQIIDYAQSWLCIIGLGRYIKSDREAYEDQQAKRAKATVVGECIIPGWR